jgi:predicted O-methyltransferase YrrM
VTTVFELDLSRWRKVWLSRPWQLGFDPSTGMVELHGVRGYLVPGDVAYLFNLAAWLPPAGCYLEIGSWMGLSAIVFANGLLASLNLRATVYCVDTWLGSPEHQALPEVKEGSLFDLFLRNVAESQLGCFVRPVRGESGRAARAWAGPPLDLVFIDGEHSLEACYRDLVS